MTGVARGVWLRDMQTADVEAGLRLCRRAGWNQRSEDWHALLANGFFRVAERDGSVVGCGGAVLYGRRLAWLAMILVDPVARGQGIASRIVADLLERVRGFDVVGLDATPQGVPVYARSGFTDRSGLARMQRAAGVTADSGGPSREIVPMTAADLDVVAVCDRRVFGADRAALLRWAFAQAPEYAWRLAGPGATTGYLFGRHGHVSEHLGPLVAEAADAAAKLLVAAAAARPQAAFTIDVPDRPGWIQALSRAGFALERPFRRMILGDAPTLGEPDRVFASLGPEFA